MQYIRRRIQRVSGVTIRDERIESRDFSVQPLRESWDYERHDNDDRTVSQPKARAFGGIGTPCRQRT